MSLGLNHASTIFFGAKTHTNFYIFITCESSFIYCMSIHLSSGSHAYGGVVNISSFSLHATILHMSLLHPSSGALSLCTLLHAVSSGIWHCTYGGVVNIFFSFFIHAPPSCTCHCFIHHFVHYHHVHYCMLFHLSLCTWWCSKFFFVSLHTTILHKSSHYH